MYITLSYSFLSISYAHVMFTSVWSYHQGKLLHRFMYIHSEVSTQDLCLLERMKIHWFMAIYFEKASCHSLLRVFMLISTYPTTHTISYACSIMSCVRKNNVYMTWYIIYPLIRYVYVFVYPNPLSIICRIQSIDRFSKHLSLSWKEVM